MVSRTGLACEPNWTIQTEYIASLATPPVQRFGLSEEKRKEVYWLLVEAEDKARTEAENHYPVNPELHLRVGQSIVLTKETPLMPEVEPADAFAALSRIRRIPNGTRVEVTRVTEKNSSPWYAVRVLDTSGSEIAVGWINSTALLGQIELDTRAQLRRQYELDDQLVQSYRKEIARQFDLTDDQLWEVLEEGIEKYWPDP